MSTCVIGLGYVGLPLAVALAEGGAPVIGFDVDAARVAALAAGRSGIEDIDDAQLVAAGGRFTADIRDAADCTAYVICVPTPLRDGLPDLSAVESASRAVATVLAPGDLVVLESTTYPGTTEEVVLPLLIAGSGLRSEEFLLAYSPERIDPGNPTWGITNTPKVVGGRDAASTKAAVTLYEQVTSTVVAVSGTREAEMAKLLENTFRHINIALVNEMAVFCRQLDIDLWEVIAAASTKPFGFMPFLPGPGVGGHCIPVDPSYLSWRVKKLGYSFRFVELAQEINARMPSYVVSRLADLLNEGPGLALSRTSVLCLGAAYKPDVSDCRESPAVDVMQRLALKGAAVSFHDPHVPSLVLEDGTALTSVELSDETLAAADAVVVLTPHAQIDWERVVGAARLVLDTRGTLPVGGAVHRL
ncbi:MAG: nucleotide sugar dehydrogenase [Frankiales bacterium]|jgi:UDP-N-acetyl-D-glucosamine dehydrogenase|nr:nucleotide sugar dehydrogenase [Frankiales bacterium]